MVHCSILIPQQGAADEVACLVPQLDQLMRLRGKPYEVLCIDDASPAEQWQTLVRLRAEYPSLRLLRMQSASGASAAMAAGIEAARGENVVLIEASRQYRVEQIPVLLERLSRADLVVGRRQTGRFKKWLLALTQTPRRLLLGLEVRDPDCLFWAARSEAVDGLELLPGMHRFLGSLVTTRGFRVTEIHVDHTRGCGYHVGREAWPRLGNLLVVWWQRQNWRGCQAREAADNTGGTVPMVPPFAETGPDSSSASGKAA
jgi:glycosyltransferase involved in cell wall biosynthesis